MEWREVTIPEYKGLYEVSEYGHIKSLNYRGHGLAKLVKTKIDKAGYVHVRL
ncbi:MAG: NUMOD4 domain-containing protein, partial [Bacillota bacterium]